MTKEPLTKDDLAALKRLKGGYVIPAETRARFTKLGLVEQKLGGDRVSE